MKKVSQVQKRQGMTQFNIRVPQTLIKELGSIAREGESAAAVATRALKEWVRMEKYPGIYYRPTATARRPFVAGTGLSVWEIFQIWQDFEQSIERVAKAYPNLKAGQINVAIAFAQAYTHEMPSGDWGEKPPFAREVKV